MEAKVKQYYQRIDIHDNGQVAIYGSVNGVDYAIMEETTVEKVKPLIEKIESLTAQKTISKGVLSSLLRKS